MTMAELRTVRIGDLGRVVTGKTQCISAYRGGFALARGLHPALGAGSAAALKPVEQLHEERCSQTRDTGGGNLDGGLNGDGGHGDTSLLKEPHRVAMKGY